MNILAQERAKLHAQDEAIAQALIHRMCRYEIVFCYAVEDEQERTQEQEDDEQELSGSEPAYMFREDYPNLGYDEDELPYTRADAEADAANAAYWDEVARNA